MKAQDRVKHLTSMREGTLCPTIYFLNEDDPLSVVYDGEAVPVALNAEGGRTAFVVLGQENAKADFDLCGAGKGAKCCAYLAATADGPTCARYTNIRYSIQFNLEKMNAKRTPTKPYPACQSEGL